MVKMQQIKERGLMPVDVLKHGHDNPDAVEALYDNDPTLARMSVSISARQRAVVQEEAAELKIVSVARQTSSRRR